MPKNDNRTEQPTPKRRREARKEGRVARSPDISGWSGVLAASFLLPVAFREASSRMDGLFALVAEAATRPDPATALRLLDAGLGDVVLLVAPVAFGYMALALLLGVGQVGLRPSFSSLTPKISRLNPMQGIKRVFSVNGVWEVAKSSLKLALVGVVAWHVFSAVFAQLVGAGALPLSGVAAAGGSATLSLLRSVAAAGLVIALADYLFQRRRLKQSLLMTRQEVKDEARQSEGDPHTKSRVRAQQRKITRLRMMAAVANADVVTVNPTHFAVALAYDPARGGAPRVVAKGADELAARIREEAARHSVPVVSDPPLARALYATCELDSEVPPALYATVAQLLAFVYRLSPGARRYHKVHRRPWSQVPAVLQGAAPG
ncbi:MAG: EscU/YscU/HrcU family type III secretion system export apparatus switch protein [Acidimicrobiales bacterium]